MDPSEVSFTRERAGTMSAPQLELDEAIQQYLKEKGSTSLSRRDVRRLRDFLQEKITISAKEFAKKIEDALAKNGKTASRRALKTVVDKTFNSYLFRPMENVKF